MSSQTPETSPPSSGNSGWRFLIDENSPRLLTRRLLSDGHFVEDCRDVGLMHRSDSEIWAYAQAHNETLITEDKDFVTTQ